MEVNKEIVRTTAELVNIELDDHEVEILQEKFSLYLDYYSVLDKVEDITDTATSADTIVRGREGDTHSYNNPHTLIEKSEEHEDGYVLIPNVL